MNINQKNKRKGFHFTKKDLPKSLKNWNKKILSFKNNF